MKFPAELIHYISSFGPYAQIGLGTASGWMSGFLIMKCCKFVSAIIGGAIILINIAEIEGLLNVEWLNIKNNVHDNLTKPMQRLSLVNADDVPPNVYNFIISFGGGSLIGIGCC